MVKIIQNYTLHEQIGEGQYGKVFRGIDSRTKKEVAVKVINVKKFKQYPKLQQCTLNQIEVLSKIESPHIVRFIEILKTANNFYFFYEFCNQGTLQLAIKSKGTLTENEALEYLSEILEAFKILASKNIMHRDLKPSNILLHDGIIKIADFGFCKSLDSHRDLAQTMLGSPIYMAPEVLKGQIYTIKADIWSLGVVIYQMLYGFCPFEERSIARLINLLDKQEVSFNYQINQISPEFEQLLKRMLIKDHFKRIQWKQIFEYQVNGVNILKKSKTVGKKQQKEQRPNEQNYRQDLKEVKNFQNIPERPASRNSFDLNYQQYSGGKKQMNSNTPSQNPPQHLFKKQTQNLNNKTMPSVVPSIQNASKPTNSNLINKENAPLTLASEPISSKIRSRIARNKIRNSLKLAGQVIEKNFCPEITVHLCLRIYQILHKQINKMQENCVTHQERDSINQTIKIFQQESLKCNKLNISGPILNHYVKNLQITHKDSFNPNFQNKQILLHCLSLMDLNQLGIKQKTGDYTSSSKEKLLSELSQKVIRNVI